MTRRRSTSIQGKSPDRDSVRSIGEESEPPFATPAFFGDWMRCAFSAPLQAPRYLQPTGTQSVLIPSTISETLIRGMSDLSRAADPIVFVAAYNDLCSQQLDECVKPLAAAMQQLFDMQLLWLGNLEKMASLPTVREGLHQREEDDVRAAWLNAQDNWLAMTQSWIDRSVGNSKPL